MKNSPPKETTPFDTLYKNLFSNPLLVKSLLQDFVPANFIGDLDFTSLQRLSGNFTTSDFRERHNDTAWRINWKNGKYCYVALLLEFQRKPERLMALRILTYSALLLQAQSKTQSPGEDLPPVFPIVIYNGQGPWNMPKQVSELFGTMPEELKPFCPSQQYFLLNENDVSEEAMDKASSLMAQVICTEKANSFEKVLQVVSNLIQLFQQEESPDLKNAFLEWLKLILRHRAQLDVDFTSIKNLEELRDMLYEDDAPWQNTYYDNGRAEGRAEGRTEGENREVRRSLQEMIEVRFGSLPEEIRTYIANSTNMDFLRSLRLSLFKVNSLQEFTELLKPAQ